VNMKGQVDPVDGIPWFTTTLTSHQYCDTSGSVTRMVSSL